MKTGLVLEGGAMRGIYTAGVLDVFLEQGIHFDGVNGVSAGALHGCSFVSGQKGRSLRYIKKYRNDKHFMSWWSFLHTGEVEGSIYRVRYSVLCDLHKCRNRKGRIYQDHRYDDTD